MVEVEVVKFEKSTNNPVAKKIMSIDDWVKFPKYNKTHYYKAYQLNFSQYQI